MATPKKNGYDMRKIISARNLPTHTQFGKPNGNKRSGYLTRAEKSEFRMWLKWLQEASECQIREYLERPELPALRKKYATLILNGGKITDFHEMINQIYGKPKETVELTNVPPIKINGLEGI